MADGKAKQLIVGAALSTAASYFGAYLFETPVAALSCLVVAGLLYAVGRFALDRYQASGQRQSRPARFD
jgi:uncharacterized membrane protein YccC